MAHHKSAKKRIRTSRVANLRNRHYRSMMKTAVRRVHEAESSATAAQHATTACAIIDRLVTKGVLHRNTGARRKSRLQKFVARQGS